MTKGKMGKSKLFIWISSFVVFVVAVILVLIFVIIPLLNKGGTGRLFDINDVSIQLNGESITSLEKEYQDQDFTLTALINDGQINTKKCKQLTIEWSFIGDNLNCTINNGLVHIGDTLGQTRIKVTVKSKNEKSAEIILRINSKSDSVLQGIYIEDGTQAITYIDGQSFAKADYIVWANFGEYQIKIADYTVDKSILSLGDTQIIITYKDKSLPIPVVVVPKTLQGISISQNPRTEYIEGENIDLTGMIVMAQYEYNNQVINDYLIDFDINKILTSADTTIRIIYQTQTATLTITVANKSLQSLWVDATDTKTNYTQGQTFNAANLVVKAVYEFCEETITDYTISSLRSDGRLIPEDEYIKINYGGKEYLLSVRVDKPYSNVREVVVTAPQEVLLSWVYYFMTDDFEDKIERNTFLPVDSDYLDRDLVFDTVNGIYEIPVGAIVTITSVNPTIQDFMLNGVEQGLVYPATSMNFVLLAGISADDSVEVTILKLSDRRTIAITNGETTIAFSYPIFWDGLLYDQHKEQIAFMFDESNKDFYNIYTVLGEQRTFAELWDEIDTGLVLFWDEEDEMFYVIDPGLLFISITIEQLPQPDETTAYTLLLWDDFTTVIHIDTTQQNWEDHLPQPERVGYVFNGWTISPEVEFMLIANWEYEFDYSDYIDTFIGKWTYEVEDDDYKIECEIVLNQNGTYTYKTYLTNLESSERELNININGIYSYNDIETELKLLTLETDAVRVLFTREDFILIINNSIPELEATVFFVLENFELYQGQFEFSKED